MQYFAGSKVLHQQILSTILYMSLHLNTDTQILSSEEYKLHSD